MHGCIRSKLLTDADLIEIETAVRANASGGLSNRQVAANVRALYPTSGVSGGVVQLVLAGLSLKDAIRKSALMPRIPETWPADPFAYFVPLENDLNLSVDEFGAKFWDRVRHYTPLSDRLTSSIKSIRYDDPYLLSPLTIRLALEILSTAPGGGQGGVRTVCTAKRKQSELRTQRRFDQDFGSDEVRHKILRQLFDNPEIREKTNTVDLERPLVVEMVSGETFVIALGHTISRMRTVGDTPFNASASLSDQVQEIRSRRFNLCTSTDSGPSWCVVIAPAPQVYLRRR